jgi:hypothetical protein
MIDGLSPGSGRHHFFDATSLSFVQYRLGQQLLELQPEAAWIDVQDRRGNHAGRCPFRSVIGQAAMWRAAFVAD